MAYTLNILAGFETGGLEEVQVIVGNCSAQNSVVRSGSYALAVVGPAATGANYVEFDPINPTAIGGSSMIVGFAFRLGSTIPDEDTELCRLVLTTGITFIITYAVSGEVQLWNQATYLVGTGVYPAANTWYYCELYFQNTDSGSYELWIDGVSKVSGTADFLNTSTGAVPRLRFACRTDAHTYYYDDIYFMTGVTGAADRYSHLIEIKAYRSNLNSATPDTGSALNSGTWVDVQSIPFTDSSTAVYSDSGAVGGHVLTDDVGGSSAGGPSGDSNITGTIASAKYIIRAYRGTGSGTNHYFRYGNSVDIYEQTPDMAFGTTAANYWRYASPSGQNGAPLSNEYCLIGFSKSSGARSLTVTDMLACVAHIKPSTNIKSWNSITYADMKSLNGVAKASIKSINGLA